MIETKTCVLSGNFFFQCKLKINCAPTVDFTVISNLHLSAGNWGWHKNTTQKLLGGWGFVPVV